MPCAAMTFVLALLVWVRSVTVLIAAEAADYVDYKEGLLQLLA